MTDVDVRCYVALPSGVALPGPRTLTLTIEDVSLQDAPATAVARAQLDVDGAAVRGGRLGPYALRGAGLERRRIYNLRGELDLDGDGRIGQGDLLSTAHCPVAVQVGVQEITVPLHRI